MQPLHQMITQTIPLLEFSVKPFFKRVVITPIGFGIKLSNLNVARGFRSSLFSKGLQAICLKACRQAVFSKRLG